LWVSQEMEKGESKEKGTKPRGGWVALYAINPFLCAMPNGFAWACESVGVRRHAHAKPLGMAPQIDVLPRCGRNQLVESNAIEAEAGAHTTLRENGTECRAAALLRRCALRSKMRTGFRKCASWKIPTNPSKVRTLFQGAHKKLRIFAETVRRGRPIHRRPPESRTKEITGNSRRRFIHSGTSCLAPLSRQ
jgi:hypothetical protein